MKSEEGLSSSDSDIPDKCLIGQAFRLPYEQEEFTRQFSMIGYGVQYQR